jgi:hypothetical protein
VPNSAITAFLNDVQLVSNGLRCASLSMILSRALTCILTFLNIISDDILLPPHPFERGCSDNLLKSCRLAYLVDVLAINEGCLQTLQDILNSDLNKEFQKILLLYEIRTQQTFVLNCKLAASLQTEKILQDRKHVFVNTFTRCEMSLDDECTTVITATLARIKEAAGRTSTAVCNLDIAACANSGETTNDISATAQDLAPQVMITLTGILLEYSFVYFVSKRKGGKGIHSALGRTSLVVVELQLQRAGDLSQTVVKFSLPQGIKAADEARFASVLAAAKQALEERLACSMMSGTLQWRIQENVVQDVVAL